VSGWATRFISRKNSLAAKAQGLVSGTETVNYSV
jgi:hypothetical protein